LDEIPHEGEQRNGDQHVVRHHAIGTLDEQVEHAPHSGVRIDAAVREPTEEHAHAHERKGGGEAEHDADADQRQHDEAQVSVREVTPRREHDHRDDDERHQRVAEPQLLAQLHLGCPFTTYWSSFSMSSSLTSSSAFSLSTSTSSTSSSREGQSPCFRQMMQRMISTMPCIRMSAPASGITVLKG